MKTKINIFKFILSLIAVLTFFSCENPVALGTMLDIHGPVVNIISPVQRQLVPVQFNMEGTANDYSGISKMTINTVINNHDFPRQWRYYNNTWEISDDHGVTWSPFADAQWIGTSKSASWKLTINMVINGVLADEGEYTFNVQAWDNAGFSDDNSFKAVVVIIDRDPPKVDISNPYLYRGINAYETAPLKALHDISDLSDAWKDPQYLGKFITQEFALKWQIEDSNDVWSIDLRFYKYDTVIDNDPNTPLPDNYIYRYYQNLPPPPSLAAVNPNDYVKPNGSATVPDLEKGTGYYDGELKNPITEKTTIKVVAVCYDAAGNPNQEKTLGYFISWPKANTPWIVFTEGLNPPSGIDGSGKPYNHYEQTLKAIEEKVFMVYPGRNIRATAFQAHGVKEVKYNLYKCDTSGEILHNVPISNLEIVENNKIIPNAAYNGNYSNIFPWEFNVPPHTGYYIFTVQAYSSHGVASEEYLMLFRVHDITFPDFTEGPTPDATNPLFMSITGDNKIRIAGKVSDATNVVSLCMVWINPESKDYAAMKQLAYFRDKDYVGWGLIKDRPPGTTRLEGEDDPDNPNRLWKINLTPLGINLLDNRRYFSYSQEVNLSDMNIGGNTEKTNQPLKSQVFLLRAQNPDGKCTIITYAPKGDTSPPKIEISEVRISSRAEPLKPGTYTEPIKQFADGETITINGTYTEDSLASDIDKTKYFRNNFEITINSQKLTTTLNLPNITSKNENGTWSITTVVGGGTNQISKDKLKDSLVVSASVSDIGGNKAEAGSSWLIESDNLKLMRISSEFEDGVYTTGNIEIFLEFSKPVNLAKEVTGTPELILTSAAGNTARAKYKAGQTNQNSRQYFVYTVVSGENTITPEYLNVIGLSYNGGTPYTTSTAYTGTSYPFAWYRGAGGEYEEVRLTMQTGKNGDIKEGTAPNQYYVRTLPTANSGDQYTLISGKHIKIDTTPPVLSSITANTVAGYYKEGDSIYVTVGFNEAVRIVSGSTPQLSLDLDGITVSTNGTVRVNGNNITFIYTVESGKTSNGKSIVVSGFSGDILDIAGNKLPAGGISNTSSGATLTGRFIETRKPDVPIIRVLNAATIGTDDANVITNTVSGNPIKGISKNADNTYTNKELSNIYEGRIWLAIQGQGSAYQYGEIEYSINDGTSWVKAPNTSNTPFEITQSGDYKIKARQRDMAGNQSADSTNVNFNWDNQDIVTRISSTTPNGIYTHVPTRNQIDIIVYFRKSLSVSAGSITINVNTSRTVNALSVGNALNSLTFRYIVQSGDAIANGANLNVTGINITATDGATTSAGVNVTNKIKLPSPAFDTSKEFKILTGDLIPSTPSFIADSDGGTGYNTETNTNFHGIRKDDGSYWTTLQITFNRTVFKGDGNIIIQQIAGDALNTKYRLPTVLTEAQYNRFKNVTGIGTYYIKGTNGYDNSNGSSDTSTKYILDYKYNPNSAITSPAFTGASPAPTDVPLATEAPSFIEAFRTAEKITIPVNSQAVTITGTGSSTTLKVRLSGSNAPQVPGATYTVTLPDGLVTDELSNSLTARSYDISLRGVAKPFVRIKKTQDVITKQAGDANTPSLTAAQPFQSYARMDCRTPGSAISYAKQDWTSNVTATNWSNTGTPNDTNDGASRPTSASGTAYNNEQITLGANNEYQGFIWWVRATATYAGNTSAESEEKAYRTVITLRLSGIVGSDTGTNLGNGDQIWIRGGDAIGSSSVPGFPFTWEDNWSNLSGKRAGIRLMTKDGGAGTGLNSSTYKFVTWDINTTAYIDFIMGVDSTSTANIAWQYGPVEWSYQRSGWSLYKERFPIYPGRHRWCYTGDNGGGTGQNFSITKYHRSSTLTNAPTGPWVNTP
jgi:hypothetical protein